MTVLNEFNQQLINIYSSWKSLGEEEKKKKINLILPIIQIISIARVIESINSPTEKMLGQYFNPAFLKLDPLSRVLEDFQKFYQKTYSTNLSQTNSSDLSQSLIDEISDIQKGVKTRNQDTTYSILQYDHKYVHAHSRVMFKYGEFLYKIIGQIENPDIDHLITELQHTPHTQTFLEVLNTLIRNLNIEDNHHIISSDIDDLENHALLNQMSNWLENSLNIPKLVLDAEERYQIVSSLTQDRGRKLEYQQERNPNSQESLDILTRTLADKGMSAGVGIETEFLISKSAQTQDQPDIERINRPEFVQRNIRIKQNLADYNARRYMRKKYDLPAPETEIEDYTLLFEDDKNFKGEISLDHFIIKHHLIDYFDKHPEEANQKDDTLKQVLNFSDAEIYFYKLFFLTEYGYAIKDALIAQEASVEMDSIYAPDLSKEENLQNALPLIQKGRFHEKLLDMIQAYEIAFGPHSLADSISKKDELLFDLRDLASESNLKIENPNVQLNLSLQLDGKHVFMPEIHGKNEFATIYYNGLAIEFLKIVQNTLANLSGSEGVLRNQELIGTALDRKKVIGQDENSVLWGSDYLQIDPEKPAFLNHRSLAAKNDTLRLSVLNLEKGIGILEIRLVGNNTHFARFSEEERVNNSGLFFIPEEILPAIATNLNEFIRNASKEDLTQLYDKKFLVKEDGRISGLKPSHITSQIRSASPFSTRARATSISLDEFSLPHESLDTRLETIKEGDSRATSTTMDFPNIPIREEKNYTDEMPSAITSRPYSPTKTTPQQTNFK